MRGKCTDLIPAETDIPRLRDKLDRRQRRVLPYGGEKAGIAIEAAGFACERGCEIEPEAVDMADFHPVSKRIHHHLQDTRVRKVERISRTCEVVVVAGIVRLQPVIGRVVDAPERQGRSKVVALGGVVVDDVEQNLDPGIVESGNRGAKCIERIVGSVARFGGEERERVIAPIVAELLFDQPAIVDESMDRG